MPDPCSADFFLFSFCFYLGRARIRAPATNFWFKRKKAHHLFLSGLGLSAKTKNAMDCDNGTDATARDEARMEAWPRAKRQRTAPSQYAAPASPAYAVLTDDALYHVLNGRCAQGRPILAMHSRWAAALACRRWRALMESIAKGDAEALAENVPGGLRNAPTSVLYTRVAASSLAMMVRDGMPLDGSTITPATGVRLTTAQREAVMVASDRSDAVAAALERASHAADDGGWRELHKTLKHDQRRLRWHRPPKKNKTATMPSSERARAVLLFVAVRWCGPLTVRLACTGCAERYVDDSLSRAVRFDRPQAVAALLASIEAGVGPHGASHRVYWLWDKVGWWGALSVADMLLDDETNHTLCVSPSTRRELSRRSGSLGDWTTDWVSSGAAPADRPACLDFCHEHGLHYERQTALVEGISRGNMAFCRRLVELNPEYAEPVNMRNALMLASYINNELAVHPNAMSWVVSHLDDSVLDESLLQILTRGVILALHHFPVPHDYDYQGDGGNSADQRERYLVREALWRGWPIHEPFAATAAARFLACLSGKVPNLFDRIFGCSRFDPIRDVFRVLFASYLRGRCCWRADPGVAEFFRALPSDPKRTAEFADWFHRDCDCMDCRRRRTEEASITAG
jgi:hypothetical protein